MKLKNILIVVKDIEKSKRFYHDLFGLDMVLDNNGNMILTEGLVLQDEKIWEKFLGKDIIPKNNSCELYFEEQNMEAFIEKLETLYPSIQYVNHLMVHSWGQKVIRFYDLDGNLIEVGTPMYAFCTVSLGNMLQLDSHRRLKYIKEERESYYVFI